MIPGDLTPSSCLHKHLHSWAYTRTHTHTQIIENKNDIKRKPWQWREAIPCWNTVIISVWMDQGVLNTWSKKWQKWGDSTRDPTDFKEVIWAQPVKALARSSTTWAQSLGPTHSHGEKRAPTSARTCLSSDLPCILVTSDYAQIPNKHKKFSKEVTKGKLGITPCL